MKGLLGDEGLPLEYNRRRNPSVSDFFLLLSTHRAYF